MEYLVIAYTILMSGTIIGWEIPFGAVIQFVLSIGLLCIKRKHILAKKSLRMALISCGILAANILLTSSAEALLLYYNMFCSLISVAIIASVVPQKEFTRKYVNIMCFLGVCSVILWALAQMGGVLFAKNLVAVNGKAYRLNLLYVYRTHESVSGLNAINKRNQGMFWEPGAYQGYLNLALMFELFSNEKIQNPKGYRTKLLVLIVTILSTQSTAGYMVLTLIIMTFYFSKVYNGKITLKIVLITMAILTGVVALMSSSVVQNKFMEDNSGYDSYLERLNDNLGGIKAALVSPIIGLGFNSERYDRVLLSYGITANSSSILMILQQFGLVAGTAILVRMGIGLWKMIRVRGFALVLYAGIFILMMSMEAFVSKPVFMLFFFDFIRINRKKELKQRKLSRLNIRWHLMKK